MTVPHANSSDDLALARELTARLGAEPRDEESNAEQSSVTAALVEQRAGQGQYVRIDSGLAAANKTRSQPRQNRWPTASAKLWPARDKRSPVPPPPPVGAANRFGEARWQPLMAWCQEVLSSVQADDTPAAILWLDHSGLLISHSGDLRGEEAEVIGASMMVALAQTRKMPALDAQQTTAPMIYRLGKRWLTAIEVGATVPAFVWCCLTSTPLTDDEGLHRLEQIAKAFATNL